jgi:hypothetical protein
LANVKPRPLWPREIAQLPIAQEAGWAPEPVRMGAESENFLTPPGSNPKPSGCNEMLYRLLYPDHNFFKCNSIYTHIYTYILYTNNIAVVISTKEPLKMSLI